MGRFCMILYDLFFFQRKGTQMKGIRMQKLPEGLDRMPFAERIKTLAALAKKADPQCLVFGSEKHQYTFRPPIDIQAVRAFESRTGLTLPEEYVRFLTEVGNGGAGIDYGLYSLENVEREIREETASTGVTLFDYENPAQVYYEKNLAMERLDEQYGKAADEQCDALYADLIRGMLVIGTAGCTFDYFIMCQGKKQGRVGILDWNMEPEREYAPALFDLTLSEWLENYFKRIILGKVIWCRCFYKVDYDAEL